MHAHAQGDRQAAAPMFRGDTIPVQHRYPFPGEEAPTGWIYDFGGTFPVEEIRIQNHLKQGDGLAFVEYSLNGKHWTRQGEVENKEGLQTVKLEGILARYVKLVGIGDGDVCFTAAAGFAAETEEAWTHLFHCQEGWTGSDGIYSIPFSADERHAATEETETLFLFGDTFVGQVDPQSDRRNSQVMINNTVAVLKGNKPDTKHIRFEWQQEQDGTPASAFVPTTPAGVQVEGAYYWLQDGIAIQGRFYCFPLIIGPNPDGPEGFQFAVHGITRVSAPIGSQGLLYEEQIQADTPLYFKADNGRTTYFGAALMANTAEAGAPDPDEHIYIYGIQQGDGPQMVAARVPVHSFEDFQAWRYWNGKEWSAVKEQTVPVAGEISCEYSVSPMSGQWPEAAYVAVFQGEPDLLSMFIGDSPVGPFSEPIRLHYCPEPEAGKSIYTYNAKAHPHLSKPGELLASYNVNTTSMDMHMLHGEIYRPRFVRIRRIKES